MKSKKEPAKNFIQCHLTFQWPFNCRSMINNEKKMTDIIEFESKRLLNYIKFAPHKAPSITSKMFQCSMI